MLESRKIAKAGQICRFHYSNYMKNTHRHSRRKSKQDREKELTPELVYEFISKIVVHAPYRKDRRRHQAIDIYYSGVGIVYIPEPEESEMMFQEHLRNLEEKQNNPLSDYTV